MFTKGHTREPQSENIPKVYLQQNGCINHIALIQKQNKTTTAYSVINLKIFGTKPRHKQHLLLEKNSFEKKKRHCKLQSPTHIKNYHC